MSNKNLSKKVLLSLLLGCCLTLPSVPAAALDSLIDVEATGTNAATQGHVEVYSGIYESIIGGKAERGDAYQNRVDMRKEEDSAGALAGMVYGGYSYSGHVYQNIVDVSGGVVTSDMAGGYSRQGNVESNSVTISKGYVMGAVYGGHSGSDDYNAAVDGPTNGGNVKNNTVTLSVNENDGAGAIYGGRAYDGDAEGNTVYMRSGSVTKDNIFGGYSVTGYAEGNEVYISGGKVAKRVYGGHSESGNAVFNTVKISGGSIGRSVYGGTSISGEVFDNEATISGAEIEHDVYGGLSTSGDVARNEVIIGNCSIKRSAYGGYSESGNVVANGAAVLGGTIDGSVYGGYSVEGDTQNNKVTIEAAGDGALNIEESVYGGYSKRGISGSNTVSISRGRIAGDVYGGASGDAENFFGDTVKNNKVIIEDQAYIQGNVYGGRAYDGTVFGNSVTISGADAYVEGIVYGGYNERGSVLNNTVNITGVPNTAGLTLRGGYSGSGRVVGNRLNVNTKGVEVKEISAFNALNFNLPSDTISGDTMLRVVYQQQGDGIGATDVSGAMIRGYLPENTSLQPGDKVILLNNEGGITTEGTRYQAIGAVHQGTSLLYYANVAKQDDNNIVLTISEKQSLNPNTKSLVETITAAAAFLNQGADFVVSDGFKQAQLAAAADAGAWGGFAAAGGNKLKVKTGSHVDIDGYTLNVGIAKSIANNSGKLLVGPVFEYGNGSYDSYLNNGLHGEGNTRYTGGGIILRQENNSGVYYEGSVRAGRVKTDYKSSAFGAGYDTSSGYVGVHLGIGMVQDINASSEMEYYGKFFYSHTGSDDVRLSSGDKYHFDSVDSARLRLGARYSHKLSELSKLYAGLAWEHEFDGDARAQFQNYSTASPSLKGSSGLLELGWQVQSGGGMNVDLNLSGWMGQQKGLTFRAAANWTF